MTAEAQPPVDRTHPRPSLADIERAIDAIVAAPTVASPPSAARQLLTAAEAVLEHWIVAHGGVPTSEEREGFRLLALHRQGAKGDPSFNACRESCRELAYRYNLLTLEPDAGADPQRLLLAALVARHILYFVSGKLQVQGLGAFCCAAKPVRAGDALV